MNNCCSYFVDEKGRVTQRMVTKYLLFIVVFINFKADVNITQLLVAILVTKLL